MADYAHEETDKLIKKLERSLKKEYKQAQKDLEKKLEKYLAEYQVKLDNKRAELDAGTLSPQAFDRWLKWEANKKKYWDDMIDTISEDYSNAGRIASQIINNETLTAFALNHNFATYEIEKGLNVNTSYVLYDRDTVKNLVLNNPDLLPDVVVDKAKTKKWNQKKINSAILQGTLQGESIPQIAKRMMDVTQSNYAVAVRNARTAMTYAQNAGRLQSMDRAEKLGIKLKKQWLATLDDRTRHEHRLLDGQTVGIHEDFEVDGQKIECPGDPKAKPYLVYNCFVGDTKIASNSEIVRSYKHEYHGDLIKIETASGVNFTCTPNHPILTPHGWVRANFLDNGDNLVVTSRRNICGGGWNSNIEHIHSRLKAFYNAFHSFGLMDRDSTLSINFHGDVPTANVEVITKKWLLRNDGDSCGSKSFNKFLFKFANKTLLCHSYGVKHFSRIFSTTLGFIGKRRKPFSFFWGRLGHSKVHGLRPVSGRDSSVSQNTINNLPAESEIIGKFLDGFTGEIAIDKIVSVKIISSGSTHVYNLQTENGYYFINSTVPQSKGKYNGVYAIAHNCRCTLISDLEGFEDDISDLSLRNTRHMTEKSYEEWKHAKEKEAKKAKADAGSKKTKTPENVVSGKNLASSWIMRNEKYKFPIQDVVNAQGFDGLPRVVGRADFDRAVKDSSFIAQRTYSAPSKEIIEAYRNQLYNGEWYIDCSVGGAQYGKGMYVAADYSGVLSDGIRAEMEHYKGLGVSRGFRFNEVETLTLDPTAKIITYDDALKLSHKFNSDFQTNLQRKIASLGKDEQAVYQRELGVYLDGADKIDVKKTANALESSDPARYEEISEQAYNFLNWIGSVDVGSVAALYGYDAINAKGHGQSGSYTVILNRTKLIILGE